MTGLKHAEGNSSVNLARLSRAAVISLHLARVLPIRLLLLHRHLASRVSEAVRGLDGIDRRVCVGTERVILVVVVVEDEEET